MRTFGRRGDFSRHDSTVEIIIHGGMKHRVIEELDLAGGEESTQPSEHPGLSPF